MKFNFNTEHWKNVKLNWDVGFVCGAFDLLHPGHILMFKESQRCCGYLVVGLQVDPSIDRRDKNSPIQSYEERFIQLDAIKYVSEIIKYETDEDLLKILTGLKPHIRILGSDWRFKGGDIIGALLSPIHWHERDHEYSTTALRKRIYMAEYILQNTEILPSKSNGKDI